MEQNKDIEILAKLLQVLQMTKQGANLVQLSLITGVSRSVEIVFNDGRRKEFTISKKLHGLPLITKVINAVQGR